VSWELSISPNVLSLSTLDNNTTTFSFVSPRYRCCIGIFVAQQQDLFPFLMITLYYEYPLSKQSFAEDKEIMMSGVSYRGIHIPFFDEKKGSLEISN
jgi:hypothetical protein